jgi:hypothetical protein
MHIHARYTAHNIGWVWVGGGTAAQGGQGKRTPCDAVRVRCPTQAPHEPAPGIRMSSSMTSIGTWRLHVSHHATQPRRCSLHCAGPIKPAQSAYKSVARRQRHPLSHRIGHLNTHELPARDHITQFVAATHHRNWNASSPSLSTTVCSEGTPRRASMRSPTRVLAFSSCSQAARATARPQRNNKPGVATGTSLERSRQRAAAKADRGGWGYNAHAKRAQTARQQGAAGRQAHARLQTQRAGLARKPPPTEHELTTGSLVACRQRRR